MAETQTNKMIRYTAKAGAMGGLYILVDKVILKSASTTKSSAVCFGAIVVGSVVGQYLADTFIKENSLFGLLENGKSIESQGVQLAGSVATGTLIEKVIFNNSYSNDLINVQSIAILAVCNVVAELAVDVLYKRPLDAFD